MMGPDHDPRRPENSIHENVPNAGRFDEKAVGNRNDPFGARGDVKQTRSGKKGGRRRRRSPDPCKHFPARRIFFLKTAVPDFYPFKTVMN